MKKWSLFGAVVAALPTHAVAIEQQTQTTERMEEAKREVITRIMHITADQNGRYINRRKHAWLVELVRSL